MAKVDLKNSAILALPVTAAVWLVSYLFGLLNLGAIKSLFASVPATSGITGTVGNKVLSFVGGIIPIQFDLMSIVVTYISAMVAIIIGSYLVNQFKLPAFKKFLGMNGNAGKIASYILWGAVPVYLLLVGFKIPSVMTVVGLVLHSAIVAIVAVYIAKILKLKV